MNLTELCKEKEKVFNREIKTSTTGQRERERGDLNGELVWIIVRYMRVLVCVNVGGMTI